MKCACDGAVRCKAPADFVCRCERCSREATTDTMFHTCATHQVAASAKHMQTHARLANWVTI